MHRRFSLKSISVNNFGWVKSPIFFSFMALVLFVIFSGILQPGYLTASHIMTVIQQSAVLIIVAIGQTFVIISGGIDLSVGAIVLFTDVFCAQLMLGSNSHFFLAVILSLLMGAGFGLFNGIGVEIFGLPPLVMTLATSIGIRGFMLLFSGGFPKGGAAPILKFLGTGKIIGIPASMMVWVVILLLAYLLLKRTKLGWGISFIGANRKAAQAMGVKCRYINIMVYILSGFLAALAGLLILGYVGISSLSLGDDYTMASITAVILGGTAFIGGIGSPIGTLSGALLLRFILTLLTAFNISASGKNVIQGIIIIVMIVILTLNEKKLLRFSLHPKTRWKKIFQIRREND